MAVRKPDAEVGPVGVWAYDTRTSLKGADGEELQPEEVAPLLPKPPHPATIRRIESNPTYNPEKMIRDLYVIYRRIGEQQGVYVPPPPLGQPTAPVDQSDLAAAIDRNTAMLKAVLEALTGRLPPPEVQQGLDQAERLADEERRRTTSRPRSIDRGRRTSDKGKELPEAAAS